MIKIEFNTISIQRHTGYGNAAFYLQQALSEELVHFSETADVKLNFCMPQDYKYGPHTIGYTPWESTKIPKSWQSGLLKVDDLWTTSTWTAKIFETLTGRDDIFVLHHGLADIWQNPVRHTREGKNTPFTFLHVGEPAVRKGGEIILEAWYRAFANRSDCRLIYKTTGIPMARVKDRSGSILASPGSFSNVEIINSVYSELELWHLYSQVDALIYPTHGEGFGFIPLEAMAVGLPTVLPHQGGTSDFSGHGIELYDSLWTNSDQAEHPGLWLSHDVDELIEIMNLIISNYEDEASHSYSVSFKIQEEYDWRKIATQALTRITSKLS
jgi:glycosyltransferase involved in cell wall biosynthesis